MVHFLVVLLKQLNLLLSTISLTYQNMALDQPITDLDQMVKNIHFLI